MSAARFIALAAAAAALLAAGCSSADTRNKYVDTVNEIQSDALDAFNQTAGATPENENQLVTQLESGEQVLADAVTKLREVDVPEEVRGDHPDLVAGIDELRELFAETAARVEGASTSVAFTAITDLGAEGAEIGQRIDAAISRINEDLGTE